MTTAPAMELLEWLALEWQFCPLKDRRNPPTNPATYEALGQPLDERE